MDEKSVKLELRVWLSPIPWRMEDVAALIDVAARKPGKRGPYKKRAA